MSHKGAKLPVLSERLMSQKEPMLNAEQLENIIALRLTGMSSSAVAKRVGSALWQVSEAWHDYIKDQCGGVAPKLPSKERHLKMIKDSNDVRQENLEAWRRKTTKKIWSTYQKASPMWTSHIIEKAPDRCRWS